MAGPRRGEGVGEDMESSLRVRERGSGVASPSASQEGLNQSEKKPCMPVIRRVRERRIIIGHDWKPSPNTIQCTGFHDMTTNVLRKCSHRIAAKPHLVTEARGIHQIVQELTAPLPVRILRSRNAATRLADAPVLVLSNKYCQRESLESLFSPARQNLESCGTCTCS